MRAGLFAPGVRPDVLTFHAARELLPPELAGAIVSESALARLPGVRQRGHDPGRWRYLLPLMPRYFRRLPLDAYDLVVSSSHAFASHVRPRRDALHVVYCYTPLRYAWLPETDARSRGLGPLRGRLKRLDLEASRRPDAYVAISTAVRDRIRRFYGRDAEVVHPPVDVGEAPGAAAREEGHFLWVHRLVEYKRPDVVVEAVRGTPYRLTMVGVGPLDERLRRDLPPNVALHGWLPRDELERLYARCAGFVHVGEEDFGITMVEALAAGTPVVALARGGALDVVRDGVDGVLVEEVTPSAVRGALARVAGQSWDPAALHARAREFSRERFVLELRALLAEVAKN